MYTYTPNEDPTFDSLKTSPKVVIPNTSDVEYDPTFIECCRMGGRVQGARNADSGHMVEIQKLSDVVENGRLGGIATMLSGKGSFADPEERREVCKLGGRVQGSRNADSGHLKKISQEYWAKVRSGEIVRKPRVAK